MGSHSNPLIVHPHIYKKGKILNFKKLDEGKTQAAKKYLFSTNNNSISSVVNSANNINQIVGRNWLGVSKLVSYFGLSKDQSENLSKPSSSTFNKFWEHLTTTIKPDTSKIETLLNDLSRKVDLLDIKIKALEDLHKEPQITKQEITDFTVALNKIKNQLDRVIGEDT